MDTFSSMTELLLNIPAQDNYTIHAIQSHQSKIKLFAPHGGCIEPCTEPITLAIAENFLDYFVFSGKRKKDCFKTLHVMSTRYDEPQCMNMVAEAEVAIAIHGCDGDAETIEVGGGNRDLVLKLLHHLVEGGYPAIPASKKMKGDNERNFINRARQKGVQVEISAGFRSTLFPGFPKSTQRHPVEFSRFIESMRSWLRALELTLSAREST